jgi:hypothetical protein
LVDLKEAQEQGRDTRIFKPELEQPPSPGKLVAGIVDFWKMPSHNSIDIPFANSGAVADTYS